MPRKQTGETVVEITEGARELAHFSIEHASEEIFWTDSDARVVYANEAACASLGYSRTELLRMSVPDFDPDFPVDKWPEHWAELKRKRSLTFDSHHRAKDGRVYPVEISANFLKFDGKEFNVAFVRDISERRAADKKLRESEERYRTVVEDQTEFVVRWLPHGTRTFVNGSYCRFWNKKYDQLVGANVFELLDTVQQQKLRAAIQALTPESPTGTQVFEFPGQGAFPRFIEWTSRGLFDEQRKLREVQSVGRDITEQKRAEAELAKQQEVIRELSTPVLPVSEGLLILPLIGSIDTMRARQMTEQLLRSIRTNRARAVVMDVTGVATIDTAVANHLIQCAEASRLLGSQVIITGISRDIAHTLVSLGVDLSSITTMGDLRRGIEEAQRLLGYAPLHKPELPEAPPGRPPSPPEKRAAKRSAA